MKLKKVTRTFLALVLASGLQLSLSTCTYSGEVQSQKEDISLEEENIDKTETEVITRHR